MAKRKIFFACRHNPKFAEHMCVPLTHLGGTSRCFASPKCRAEHVNVPLGPLQWGWRCFAIIGLRTGISPNSRTRKAILCRMRRAAVRHRPILAPGARVVPFWRLLMGIHVRLFGGMAPCSGRSRVKPAMKRGGACIDGTARALTVCCPLGGGGTGTERGRRSRRGTDGHVFAGFSCP